MRTARLISGDRLAVVLVAHGSRDPRAASATEALARAVRRAQPAWAVRTAYLDHAGPRPLDVLSTLPGRRAVVVPLLLTAAYHGRVDLPAVLEAAAALPLTITLADVLGPLPPAHPGGVPPFPVPGPGGAAVPAARPGARSSPAWPGAVPILPAARGDADAVPSFPAACAGAVPSPAACAGAVPSFPAVRAGAVPPQLIDALVRRLPPAGLDGVVLSAAGTRDAGARSTVEWAAEALSARLRLPCTVAYASAAPPAPAAAVDRLRASGCRRVGMAAYFLAPGFLYDRAADSAREAGAVTVAEPLGDAPELAALVAARVEAVAIRPLAAA